MKYEVVRQIGDRNGVTKLPGQSVGPSGQEQLLVLIVLLFRTLFILIEDFFRNATQ